MTEREALKLALKALENLQRAYREAVKLWDPNHHDAYTVNSHSAIADIREALALSESSTKCEETSHAQSEQEPVVWMYQNKSTHEVRFQKHMRSFVDHGAWYEVPLYSEPLANQEKTSGSPKPAKTEALRLADAMEYDLDWCDEAAAELRRMHDLLGKANALCRIRAEEIERLKAQPEPVIDKSAAVRIATSLGWDPKRKPLTDEQKVALCKQFPDHLTFNAIHAIEAAHGIKE